MANIIVFQTKHCSYSWHPANTQRWNNHAWGYHWFNVCVCWALAYYITLNMPSSSNIVTSHHTCLHYKGFIDRLHVNFDNGHFICLFIFYTFFFQCAANHANRLYFRLSLSHEFKQFIHCMCAHQWMICSGTRTRCTQVQTQPRYQLAILAPCTYLCSIYAVQKGSICSLVK